MTYNRFLGIHYSVTHDNVFDMKLPKQLQYLNKQLKYVPKWQPRLNDVLSRDFPRETSLVLSFGSGHYEASRKKETGVIFVVKNAVKWHQENYQMHKTHYKSDGSLLSQRQVEELSFMEDHAIFFKEKLSFSEDDAPLTYGVLPLNSVINDLDSWEVLCAAGILHSPVNLVNYKIENSLKLVRAMQRNLFHATLVSLLLLPDSFTEDELYSTVSSLSQSSKVLTEGFSLPGNSIRSLYSAGSSAVFGCLYHPVLLNMVKLSEQPGTPYSNFFYWDRENRTIEQDKSEIVTNEHLKILPLRLQTLMCRVFDSNAQHIRDVEEIMKSIARYPEVEELVRLGIHEIIEESEKKIHFL